MPVLDERTIERLAALICDDGGPYERRARQLSQFLKAVGWDTPYDGGARVPWLEETIRAHNDDVDAIEALLRRVVDPREYDEGMPAAQHMVGLVNGIVAADGFEVGHEGHRTIIRRIGEDNALEQIAARLAAPELRQTIRGLVFQPVVADVLIARLDEVEAARRARAFLLAVVGTGSFIEGLLDEILRSRDKETRAQNSTTLQWLLKRAHTLGWIEHDALTFNGYVREYRNFVHPREQLANNFSPDDDTVLLCWQPVLAIINDLDRLIPGRKNTQD
ncbi:hypothetical protein ACQEVB_39630 [Pseudonocardia sp. CA-107938]|uniref:hypothetical protein n=1 Tax=Pseudonocardia sp. CA-107938 TaxID=3240021 RepID=UPI003D8B01D5